MKYVVEVIVEPRGIEAPKIVWGPGMSWDAIEWLRTIGMKPDENCYTEHPRNQHTDCPVYYWVIPAEISSVVESS